MIWGAIEVRDHMHLPPYTYRGAAHNFCNLQFQFRQGKRAQNSKFYIPIVFHNLRGYDSHLLMESAVKICKDRKLSVIPNHSEKYLPFYVGNLKFIDSLQFLNESLETSVANLSKENAANFAHHFPNKEEFKLLLRTDVYPYDLASSPAVFSKTSLSHKCAFYNKHFTTRLRRAFYRFIQCVQ